MNKILTHEVSKFGKVNIALHHLSTDFYELLNDNGLIDHLKNLDHLGFISKSHPGNSHKRWDYVMLQMHLLHKLKDEVFRTGLSSNHKIDDENQTTGIVILQIAVLFSNIGHLKGTLASETGLIQLLKSNSALKNEFFVEINKNTEWRKFCDDILKNNDYYKTKYLVGLNFLLNNDCNPVIMKVILMFFKNALIDDDPKLRKLKWLFYKVRQISFLYLDSFNSDFPFQIDISKILLNIYNYKTLFNPNSYDFESFFDSAETTLTKKLYISPLSAEVLHSNCQNFKIYIKKEISRKGANKLLLNNFLVSLISRSVKPLEILPPNGDKCYQFYLSKEDIEFFGIKRTLFNYDEAVLANYSEREEFESLLNRNLSNKLNKVCLIHDGRRTLFYNNIILNQNNLLAVDQNQFLLNYFNTHNKFLTKFRYTSSINGFKSHATIYLHKHYVRKIFLQLYRIIFKFTHDLSAYIKFDNHQLITQLAIEDPKFHVSGYSSSKNSFKKYLEKNLSNSKIPLDIKNNNKLAKYILEHVTEITRNINVFYCAFPVEIEKYDLDPTKLYKQQNPESAKTLTDIDMVMVIFNNTKFEFYIIEGKKQSTGFEAATRDDFNNKIRPYLLHPNMMPEIQIINDRGTKGGYICYRN
jgi:hypothetical protein